MNVWTCAIRCDVRGCMAKVGGTISADNEGTAIYYAEKDARLAGWHLNRQDGTDDHKCPEHRPKQ